MIRCRLPQAVLATTLNAATLRMTGLADGNCDDVSQTMFTRSAHLLSLTHSLKDEKNWFFLITQYATKRWKLPSCTNPAAISFAHCRYDFRGHNFQRFIIMLYWIIRI